MTAEAIDMSIWQGREDPEPDSERWHQRIRPLRAESAPGVVLLGFAGDAGVRRNLGRPGAAAGPAAIRLALVSLAWHRCGAVYEGGDVACEGDALEDAQARLGRRVSGLLADAHVPVVLGGGHEVAFGSWQGIARYRQAHGASDAVPRIGIVNFDAHFDLRDPKYARSSGTPFAEIAADCRERHWPFQYACLGVSRASNTRALFNRAAELGVLVCEDRRFTGPDVDGVADDLTAFLDRSEQIYLTIDLDVLPAFEAPGVSAPAAYGVSLTLLEPLIELIRDSGKLLLADIAECNPTYDIDNRTARVAARLIHVLTSDA